MNIANQLVIVTSTGGFIVSSDTQGISISKPHNTIGFKSSSFCDCVFDKVELSFSNGFESDLTQTRAFIKLITSSIGIGIMKSAFEHAEKYSKERTQFGKQIGEFEAIQNMLQKMEIDITASRLMLWKMAAENKISEKETNNVFLFIKNACEQNTIEAVQILGGYGYSKEYPVEKLMRDAKMLQMFE